MVDIGDTADGSSSVFKNPILKAYSDQLMRTRATCDFRGYHRVNEEVTDPKNCMICYDCDSWFGINDEMSYKVVPITDS